MPEVVVNRFEAVDYEDPSKVLEKQEQVDNDVFPQDGHDKNYWKLFEFFQKNHKRFETVKLKCQNRGITVKQISLKLGINRNTVARYLQEFREIRNSKV